MTTFSTRSLLPPVLLLAALAPAQETVRQRLTLADVQQVISWQGALPAVRWAADGRHLEVRDGTELRWFDPVTKANVAPAAAAAAPAPAPRRVVRLFEGDLWLDAAGARGNRPGKDAVRLTDDGAAGGRKAEAHLSPDQRHVSYTVDNDLVVLDVATRGGWRVADGGPERFCGILDWVYQEEVYGRGNFQGHWWSPRADRLAFLALDESTVREFTIVDHVPDGFLDRERVVHTEVANYPKVGDPNPQASVAIAVLDGQKIVPVDLSRFPQDVLVVRVDWTPDGALLLLTLQDRIQCWAELCAVDPATGAVTTWIREVGEAWVNRPEPPRWLADGTFLWLSERTGYQHVYRYAKGGKLLGALTSGEWQVRGIVRVDEPRQLLWFEGTKDGATGRHLYRIGWDGQGLVCLTPGIGTHGFELDRDGAFVLDRHSAMDRPTAIVLRGGEDGAEIRSFGQADRGAGDSKYLFCERRRLSIAARDGYELDASLMLPPDWQAAGRYPVYLPTYSGPDAPSVRDAWQHSSYEQFVCQQGFLVLQVNVRSASGRGQRHAAMCYRQLGVVELRDLEDAVQHVCAHFAGDPARVAISGWSYGGFMTAFALTHSTKFALGLAGAGVYDWRLYDSIYTERFMRLPQDNAAGYDATSVIKAAANLHGHLVLLHGTMDDNVHVQNTVQLLWELQKAGKQDFELMLYPKSRHGLHGAVSWHSREFQWLRLQKLLDR